MHKTSDEFGEETQALRRRLGAIDAETVELEAKLAKARDQRDRLRAALEALTPAPEATGKGTDGSLRIEHTGKYRALWRWLIKNGAGRLKLSFSEVEDVLGFPLPPSSRRHLPHWYGYGGSAVARAIHDAGYTASRVNLKAETVEFVKRSPS